jgi:alpha-1,6-mannosyltransferase
MINSANLRSSAALGLLLVGFLPIHWSPFQPVATYAFVFVFTSLVFLYLARQLFASESSSRFMWIALAAAFILRLSFISLSPIGSDDVYRYMWEGKLQSHWVNPYLYAPDAPQLDSLHTPLLPAAVNHPDMKTVYFPFSQWVFYSCYQLSGENIWGYKLILLIAELATLIGLLFLLRRLNIPPKYVLLYVLCPLPVIQFALDAHIDAVGLPLLIFGLFAYLRGNKISSYVLFALSISVKPVALLVLPIVFLHEKGLSRKAQVVAVPAIVVGGQFLPYVFGSNPFEGLTQFAEHWTFNGAVFETLYLYFSDNQKTRLVCAILLCLSLLILYTRKKEPLDIFYFSVLLLLILSPVVHPWYVSWLAVVLPFARRWSGIVYASAVSLTVYTTVNYKLYGNWIQSPLILALEYIPVILLMFLELGRSERKPVEGSA